ncbi:protein kinase domain-containing protein [Sinomonas mesophila]|uniref:protein kinase domain-containing protein n=1 Tax=Sinomonas mesophila TaxID=1531955 RepID=UPI0009847D3D|nr:protein kinase [Sinomonas mesophila]
METQPPTAPPGGGQPEPPALPGYDLVRHLGTGAAGHVWLVREAATGRALAAKVIVPTVGDDRDVLAAARRELRIAAARPHEHVLAVRDAIEVRGTEPTTAQGHGSEAAGAEARLGQGAIALLADYAAGGSLGRLVAARGRLAVGETVTSVAPVAQALGMLHAEGTVHGDVSPGNVLFTARGKPLLADFGLARMVGDSSAGGAGTPGFVDPVPRPPEEEHVRTAARDVFSLGALAWFCLTGSPPPPTAGRPPLSLLVEDVPAELAAAIEAALRDDPLARPTAAEFAHALLRSARAEPVDLAPAVDAAVIPELLTRVQAPPAGRWPFAGLRRSRRRPLFGAEPGDGGTASRPRRAPRARRLPVRMGVLLACSAALVLVAVAVGAWWAAWPGEARTTAVHGSSAGDAEAPGSAGGWASLPERLRTAAGADDPVRAVQALSDIRSQAIAASDRALLEAVSVPGSAAAAADAALLDALERDGQRLEGFRASVTTASLDPKPAPGAAEGSAVVRVRIVTSGYTVLDAAGGRVGEQPAGRDQDLRIVLERVDGRWRVASVLGA